MKMRIATFNLENLDDKADESPPLDKRIPIIRPQIERLNADILCLQEVNGQETDNAPRDVLALKKLLQGTKYEAYHIECTKTTGNEAYDERNLVFVSRFPMSNTKKYHNDKVEDILYRKLTTPTPEPAAVPITFERPIFYTNVQITNDFDLHLFNVHLKSRLPTNIQGQRVGYAWRNNAAWAEGFFISSMKRVGQALEMRLLIDELFDSDGDARIIVCGDFNAHPDEVPVEAIAGRVENNGNPDLTSRTMVSCETSIPTSARYTYLHHGQKRLLDHMLISRNLLQHYCGAVIHNEMLHDESIAFAMDTKYPESDHAPFVGEFEIPS